MLKFKGRLETVFTLLAPLSHIGKSHGPDSYLDTQDILDPDGKPVEVFVYHGNAWRGALRDAGAKYLLDILGAGSSLRIPLQLFYLLFSGGSIGGDQSIDIEQAKRIREGLPLLSVFGGGVGNQLLPGKISVGDAYPLSREVQHLLPESLRNERAVSWRQMTTERSHSRKDDAKDNNLSTYLQTDEDVRLLEAEQSGGQLGLLDDPKPKTKAKSKSEKEDKPQQMRYTMECLSAGSRLWQQTSVQALTELEMGALVSAIHEWASAPYIGGQTRIGFGLCAADITWKPFGGEEEVFVKVHPSCLELGETAKQSKAMYDDFLSQYTAYLNDNQEGLVGLLAAAKG
ncbi:RAMP superfamily CRISPR-associated protein [Alicyclobacillus suci]|uniref:RAMP superfamily CRISPR-associated protein n=1 Tax=Alicyclobacillus suci TaxID=2816080 RepID=UPI001A8D1678|nr:RAMP superfamily CRISPR-associated protein [Alicyclobacillus suci]